MTRIFRPEELSISERYKLMTAGIAPRPIALVSTVSPGGRLNLAPFSYFTGLGSEPMTLLFCPANDRQGEEKDTLANCKPAEEGGSGQFVVNVVVEDYLRRAVAAAEALPRGESEFDLSGLRPAPSIVVHPPRVAEAPLAFECRTLQVMRFRPGAPSGANLVIGEVVCVVAEDGLFDERLHLDEDRLRLVGRLGGLEYARVRDRFTLKPGRAALEGEDEPGNGPPR